MSPKSWEKSNLATTVSENTRNTGIENKPDQNGRNKRSITGKSGVNVKLRICSVSLCRFA